MKKSIKDFNLKDKVVIIRCDFNVPFQNNMIIDDTRIKESIQTIKYAIDNDAKIILLSHLGKIKTEEDKQNNSLFIVSKKLEELLKIKVAFSSVTHGDELEELVNKLNPGDVLLVENTRFEDLLNKRESSCDLELAKYWASLGDIFINDAYGMIHRKHASNYGIAKFLPNGIGFLLEKELQQLDNFMNSQTGSFTLIMGGKKIEDKIPLIRNLIKKCDKLLIGGGMASTFLKVQGYNVGSSVIDENSSSFAKEMLELYANKIVLPLDVITNRKIVEDNFSLQKINSLSNDDIILDIGQETITLFSSIIKKSGKVLMNGPLGLFEIDSYCNGTKEIFNTLNHNYIKTLICGGDTISALNKLLKENEFIISTGGGATLSYLAGSALSSLDIIEEKEVNTK